MGLGCVLLRQQGLGPVDPPRIWTELKNAAYEENGGDGRGADRKESKERVREERERELVL